MISCASLLPDLMMVPSLFCDLAIFKQLGQLNSRLAAYIEKVRSLELENGRLEQQVSHYS